MPQWWTIGVGIVLSILAVVSGSISSRSPTIWVAPSAATAQERVLTPLKIGLPTGKTSFANVDVVIAQEMGFFKQQALDVTIQNFDSGVKVVQAVVAGDVAIGGASIEPVVNAAVAGGKVAIIGTYANRLTVSMVTPKTITAVTELKGKHVGIQDVGAFREVMDPHGARKRQINPAGRVLCAGLCPWLHSGAHRWPDSLCHPADRTGDRDPRTRPALPCPRRYV